MADDARQRSRTWIDNKTTTITAMKKHVCERRRKRRQHKIIGITLIVASVLMLAMSAFVIYYKNSSKDQRKRIKTAITVCCDKVDTPYKGKTILWVGTSIPTDDYPYIVGKALSAKVIDVAASNSMMRKGFATKITADDSTGWDSVYWRYIAYSLTLSSKEKEQYLQYAQQHANDTILCNYFNGIDYNIEQWQATSYDKILEQYLDQADCIFIDHGFNDGSFCNAETFYNSDVASRDRNYFYGACNFFIDKVQEMKPECDIVVVSHYSRNNINYGGEHLVWQCQQKLADYRHLRFVDISDKLPFTVDNITQYMPDGLHPSSDKTNRTSMMIADVIAKELSK